MSPSVSRSPSPVPPNYAGGASKGVEVRKSESPTPPARPPSPPPSVSLLGFEGNSDTRAAQHPYKATGHVGYSFNDGQTIYGFGPKVPDGMTSAEAIANLAKPKNKDGAYITYPGKVTDDTAIFRDVANSRGVTASYTPQLVYKQDIPVTKEQFKQIRERHDSAGLDRPMEDTRYGFPFKDRGSSTYNCATYPSTLGIPVPENSGLIRNYVPKLMDDGEVWKP